MKKKKFGISLSEQMAVCDGNYIRISRLLGKLNMGQRLDVLVPDFAGLSTTTGLKTSLEVVESFKYTSTIRIALHHPQEKKGYFNPPEMLVRMYHDANTSEVISYQQQKYFLSVYPVPNYRMYEADEKQQINQLLMEWLTLCQQEGIHAGNVIPDKHSSCLTDQGHTV